ncbi:AAA family ATPase [Trichothermofontia sichuanensis B231]|uniref:R3H domain-containing nucleic acid-binding protein n=1 Tax=Trichothermofontia sichuanensis TaxID=3045816 RepID=UPI0022453117|nr:R3H domain-containing nucleic acid-binding protein [Trichothermofontia sichuanensis]UZQ52851.1 AAA family ATPase [Trichothermofontia sichuanensis B231]
MQITDDLNQLLDILPDELQSRLRHHPDRDQLVEVVMDLGRVPEARFPHRVEELSANPVTRPVLATCVQRVGSFSSDNRAGIEQTLHRISAIRNRTGDVVGLTCRVGRAIFGTTNMIRDLVETGRSLLLLGRPGVGKTTALREIARVLADELRKRVVIIDTSNEIAGDGDIPHPAIGRARRMQVARPELQHQVMIEAVENHMPEVIIIDEIGTELEALAARTIAERGVQLVGTAHGNQIANLIKNPTLSDLIGGIQSVTLGDEEARRRGSQKTVLERKAPPTFEIAIEMLERQRWVVHEQVAETVDSILRGRPISPQIRTINEAGKVVITRELPPVEADVPTTTPFARGWQASGRMVPLPNTPSPCKASPPAAPLSEEQYFAQLLDASLAEQPVPSDELAALGEVPVSGRESVVDFPVAQRPQRHSGAGGDTLYIYPYAVGRQQLEQAVHTLALPVVITKNIDEADVILTVRSQVKGHSKLKHLAKMRQVPIHAIKASTLPHIVRALRRMLNLDEPAPASGIDLSLFSHTGSDDELEALEETRLAVEQIVLPKGQPVELLPRSAKVRRMQHELVEHYHLKSASFGEEPNRRLRIYPA